MILILSDEDENSTLLVIDWLLHLRIPYIRLNDTSLIDVLNIKSEKEKTSFALRISDPSWSTSVREIHSDEITGFWYRRGFLNIDENRLEPGKSTDKIVYIKESINKHLKNENSKIFQFLNHYFQTVKHIGSFFENDTNKFHNSMQAALLGLEVPDSLITRSKAEFLQFHQKTGSCIVKALDRAGFRIGVDLGLGNTTHLLDENDISSMPDTFNYTLFQQFIDKEYDLRVFYLEGKFYSTAILSQINPQTRIDFRNYDTKRPNRIVPYQLPSGLEVKLDLLMKALNLKSGSIDLVKDSNQKYFFLEINPIGQYGFTGSRCNFQLDKQIALYFDQLKVHETRN
jgi:ATP-GRASP peptide maturase of grasp-with-spasm system